MQALHDKLVKMWSWYSNWHNHPRYQHAHWAFFIVAVLTVFSFIFAQAQSSPSGTIRGYYASGTGVVLDYTTSDLCVDSNGSSGAILRRDGADIFLITSNLSAGTKIDNNYGGPGTYTYAIHDAGCGISSQQVELDRVQVTVPAGTGTIWTNVNSCAAPCDVVVDYNTQNVSSCSIHKNGSAWRSNLQPRCPAGTETDNSLPAGTYTYSLRDDDTGNILDSTTVNVRASGGPPP